MDAIYHWAGLVVFWAVCIGGTLWLLIRWPLAYAVAFWMRFLNSDSGNRFWVCKDFLYYLFTGRARWQEQLTQASTLELLAGWNNRSFRIARLRRAGPYRRNLLAWIIRRQRAALLY